MQTHRRLFDIRLSDGALVEVGIDQTMITAFGPVKKPAPGRMTFVELEIELKEGEEESLRQLAAETQQRFGLLAARLSKFERGLQTAGLSPPRASRGGVAGEHARSWRCCGNGRPHRPIRPSTWPMAACSSSSRR